jgi:RNA polymerase sigma-70 factor (ECF subfamily)
MLVDPDVVLRAGKKDEAAYNQVVAAYRRRTMATVARLIGRPEDVEDVTQEVFLRLYYSLEQLRTPEVFETWLYRLTVNSAYDYLRKQRRRKESRLADLAEEQVVVADAEASAAYDREANRKAQVREYAQSLLGHLSEEDRLLLLLKEVEGLSVKELEKIYKASETAIKVRLFRARQRVLKALGKKVES